MKLEKQLWCLARLALPALGFVLTSSGAYLVSLENPGVYCLMRVLAYVMIVLGFLLMISGVFWSVCHSMRSKVFHRGAPQQRVHIFTIDRPSSFPPSYEESQSSQCSSAPSSPPQHRRSELVLPMEPTALAPPLYSQDSAVLPDCSWSWEPPPPYTHVVGQSQDTT